MDAVAKAAGVSKATLYAHFKRKEDRFAAIISAECQNLQANSAATGDATDARKGLVHLAQDVLNLLLSPKALAAHRVVIAESQRFPELGRAFFEAGPKVTANPIAEFLQAAHESGELRINNPTLAAEQFMSMIRSSAHLEALLGLQAQPNRRDVAAYVESCVDLIVRGYAP